MTDAVRAVGENADPAASASAQRADLGIDLLLLRRIARLFVPFWTRAEAWPYWIGMAAILGQTALSTYLGLQSSFALKHMTNALTDRDWPTFQWQFLAYVILFASGLLITGLVMILSAWIIKAWRIWLTERIVRRYLAKRVYYEIARHVALDNPDQRIQESLSTVVTLFFGLPATVLGATGSLAAGSAVLGTIDGRLALTVAVVSVAQCVATYLGYVPLVRLRYAAAIAEGNLCYGLSHVRANAEAIAFYEGETVERARLHVQVDVVVWRDLVVTLFRRLVTDMAPLVFGIVWLAIPYILLAPRFFAGEIDFGTVTQGIVVTALVADTATALLGVLAPLSGVAPHAVRVAQIIEHFDAAERRHEASDARRIGIERASDAFALHDLCLETPSGERRLVQGLALSMEARENLVIVGRTGVGKSSLLRAMAGLWTRGSGRVVMPPASDCLFLPQQPYVTLSDLRTQILYPHQRDVPDVDLLAALDAVRLSNLAKIHGGLSAVKDWGRILSLGEQQRLAFARVLIARPRLVLLDEATSAVDADTETHLYRVLAGTGARFVSVGHRIGIMAHHAQVLTLEADGAWSLEPVEASHDR